MRRPASILRTRVCLRKSAFTLVELLVVMAIIAVLAGLAFSVFATAAKKKEDAVRISNMRQIGAAIFAYASENNGKTPVAGGTIAYGATDPETGLPSWQEQIDQFLSGARKVFAGVPPELLSENNWKSDFFLGSKAVAAESAASDGDFSFGPLVLARIEHPTRYMLVGPVLRDVFETDDADRDNYTPEPMFDGDETLKVPMPVFFADGHVAKVDSRDDFEDTYDGTPAVVQ